MLLNPHAYDPQRFGHETRRLLRATIDWFESRGKGKLAEDYHARTFYAQISSSSPGKNDCSPPSSRPRRTQRGTRPSAGTRAGSPHSRRSSASTGSTTGIRGRSERLSAPECRTSKTRARRATAAVPARLLGDHGRRVVDRRRRRDLYRHLARHCRCHRIPCPQIEKAPLLAARPGEGLFLRFRPSSPGDAWSTRARPC